MQPSKTGRRSVRKSQECHCFTKKKTQGPLNFIVPPTGLYPITPERSTVEETPAHRRTFASLFTPGSPKQKELPQALKKRKQTVQPKKPLRWQKIEQRKNITTVAIRKKQTITPVLSTPPIGGILHKKRFLAHTHLTPHIQTPPDVTMPPKAAFYPPKSRKFMGNRREKDPAVFDTWKQEMWNYLNISGIDTAHQ